MSRQSALRGKLRNSQSSDGQSLPQEWGSVQKRLEYIQTAMIKVQKRSQKLQKKVDSNEQQLSSFRREFKRKIEEIAREQNDQIEEKERQLEVENIKGELEELHSFVKRIEKKSNQMFKELRNGGYGSGGVEDVLQDKIDLKIQEKLEKSFQKNKAYIDRAVVELKNLLKQYVKDQAELQNKITYTANEVSRSNSKSRMSYQKNSQKSIKASNVKAQPINQFTETSFDDKSKGKSPRSIQNNGSSRVSYLREKLKQFEEINKKYEDKTDKKGPVKDQEKVAVQKMKQFKNYLEQSQSQVDQSNLQIKENNVLTDSIKKWRSGQKYRYD